ncbi:hypothetical protein PV08_02286 [Exophiala spinifera]|uniref:BD-FAE-like domain-containing protein n=1 Tax=Exophiala spinifera TaxID=91928 RepID=A0A0D2C350_9EURO|nr:uncharacterized protein PV08_02286 [Exophiala spinifera]KIW17999.1 hypothetical protein PV08_02286 [Exophiala spinifera]
MDTVIKEIVKETIKFSPGDEEKWRLLYEPLYTISSDIQVISDRRYGAASRNLLDVYVPPKTLPCPNAGRPVLFYVHGGGFISGDKVWSKNVYANIGYYFASLGIVTICVNHQLVPGAKYPDAAVDMQLAREWVYNNISSVEYGFGDPKKVILFGHSSGGAHLAMNLYAAGDTERHSELSDRFAGDPTAVWPPVAGVIFLDVPFWMDSRKPGRQYALRNYYGSYNDDIWYPKSPLGLLERLEEGSPALDSQKLPVYLGTVEWEIPETSDATGRFFEAYRKRSKPEGSLPLMRVSRRHNHLSVVLSIGTTDTSLSDSLLEFIRGCVGKWQDIAGPGAS